ncbi:MAG: PilN domain-containing protein [Phycisphaerales bacterium]
MNSTPKQTSQGSQMTAALHKVGSNWRVVIASRDAAGSRMRMVDSRTVAVSNEAELATWLDQQQVDSVICVLPAQDVICRTTTLPQAPDEQLLPALALQAETYLEGVAPGYRQALAVTPGAAGESSRAGLLVAWPLRSSGPTLPIDLPTLYGPDVAALAALLNGDRTSDPVMWLDRNDGSIALAVPHAQGVMFRASREESSSSRERWTAGVTRLIVETAMNVGHSDEYTDALLDQLDTHLAGIASDDGRLLIPAEMVPVLAKRLPGAPEDTQWWSAYGIAAGAIIATNGPLAPLFAMKRDEPVEHPSRIDRWADRLSSRRAAAMWLVAAIAVLALAPLAVAAARVATLYMKVGPLKQYETEQRSREMQLAMYEELSRNTWPMAKVLADVVNCAPQGITIETLVLDEGDGKVDVRGKAESDVSVREMVDALIATKVFEDVTPKYDDRDRSGAMSFTIAATITGTNAFRRIQFADDYAEVSLAERLYGERARRQTHRSQIAPLPPVEDVVMNDGEENSDDPNANRDDGISRDEFGGRTGARQRPDPRIRIPSLGQAGVQKPEMPAILTPDDIAELSRDDAMEKMLAVVNLHKDDRFTDEEKKQLEEQRKLLMEHLRSTSNFGNNRP